MDAISVAGETVSAAAALAGLLLVYLGSLTAGYSSFEAVEKRSVKSRYLTRAWFAFSALLIALISAALGVLGKWLPCEPISDAAVIILFVAFASAIFTAYLTVQEIQ